MPEIYCGECEAWASMVTWRTAETAPRDKKPFLGLDPRGNCHVVWYDGRGFVSDASEEWGEFESIEFWLPIPTSPKGERK